MNNKGLVNNKGFYRRMLALAIPIAMQNMLTSCAHLIDTAMVTRLGNVAVSAVGVAGRWTLFVSMIFVGLCSGSSVLISQYWGAKDERNIRRSYGLALVCAAFFAVLYTVCGLLFSRQMISLFTDEAAVIEAGAEYLRITALDALPMAYAMVTCAARRSTESVRVPLISAGASVVVNTLFNWCLIYGHFGLPALGTRGAAIATVLGVCAQALVVLISGVAQRHFTVTQPKALLGFDRAFVKSYLRIAGPVVINETLWCVAFNLYSVIYAHQGSENYAAYTIYDTVEQLFFVFYIGFCNACAIMTGKAVGEGGHDVAYRTGRRFLLMMPVLAAALGVLIVTLRWPIIRLLDVETPATAQMAAEILLFYAFWAPLRQMAYIGIVGIFRAGGDTRFGLFIDIGGSLLIGLPAAYLLAYVFHVPFTWLVCGTMIAEDSVKAPLVLHHFRKRHWIHQLTDVRVE